MAALVARLAGPGVAVAATDPRAEPGALFAEEHEAMPRAVDKRRREYAAGRAAAHRAMAKLGQEPRPVGMAPSRAPVWPSGLVGSLSHTDTTCVAAVARAAQLRGIGIDIEEDAALGADLVATICTLDERAWLASQPVPLRGQLAKLIFSAKESVYKCQYPVSRQVIDFAAVLITPDLDTGQFEAAFRQDVGPFLAGTRLSGRFAIEGGLILSAVVLAPALVAA